MNSQDDEQRKNGLKRMYLIEKQEHILDRCFATCTDKSKPGSTLTGRQVTCSGTSPPT